LKRFFAIAAVLILLILAACGGDDDDGTGDAADVTPVGTKEATPVSATPADGNTTAPPPAEPELDEELSEVTRGQLQAVIDPGGVYEVDPESIALNAGATDPCANFQFDFSWQISDPYPADGTALVWLFDSQGGQVEVASGPAGNQAVGCGLLTARNDGAEAVVVDIKYAVGVLP
jgi:hypothetical protein